jgi:hypothetical protein
MVTPGMNDAPTLGEQVRAEAMARMLSPDWTDDAVRLAESLYGSRPRQGRALAAVFDDVFPPAVRRKDFT